MTLGELRTRLAYHLGLDSTTSDGLIAFWDANALNDAARFIADRLSIPRLWVDFTKNDLASGTLNMPSEAETIVRAVVPPDTVVPIVSADDYVEDDRGTLPRVRRFARNAVLVNENASPITVKWLGAAWEEPPDRLRIIYKPRYTPMVNETDQPWGGAYPRYHELIALRAALDMLGRLDPGEPETVLRMRVVNEEYQRIYSEFASDLDPIMYFASYTWPV